MYNIVNTGDVVQIVGELGGAIGELASSIRELLQNFTGTPEQIEQLQTENEQQDSYVEELLADETIPQNIRNELAANHNAYNASSQDLINEATQGGPNPEGYNTANQIQAYNDLEESIQEAESYRDASSSANEIAFDPEDALAIEGATETNIVVYVSPAGVPVALPGDVPVKYYTVANGITAYGALQSFTIEDGPDAGEYKAHKKGNEFTGYKINKDSEPYDFGPLPDPNNIFVRTIDQGLGCSHLLLEGRYQPTNVNTTGMGSLVTDWGDIQWDLLPIEKQGYTTCLPPLDYDGFAEYVMGTYNPFGYGGFLRKVVAMDGSVAHVYSIADQENGWIIHYQYNRGNGRWEPIAVPEYDVDTAAALDYLFGQVFSSAAGHLVLDLAGMVLFAGEAFDLANGVWYYIEGDGTNAAISLASTIPLVYATTVKNAGKIVKLANGTTVLVKFSKEATERLVDVLKRLDLDAAQLKKLSDDLTDKEFAEAIAENPELVDSWGKLFNLGDDVVPQALRRDPNFLGKFDDVAKNNTLGLDADGVSDLLKSPSTKIDAVTGQPLKWDNPDGVLDAIRRTSDSGVDGVSISHKKFPTPGDGSDPFVLKNAKQYQAEASGDAGLSFDKNGVSFDNVDVDGKLVDRKYGHSSVFNADGTVANQTRANSILDQAERQLNAVGGDASKIRWEISSEGGANGIERLFLDNPRGFPGLEDIEVVHVAQQTIIN
jgi:hypothetical protein